MQQYELISCHTKNQRVVFSALCRNKLFTFKLIIFVSLRFNHQSLHHPIQIQYQWCQLLQVYNQIVQSPSVNYVPKSKSSFSKSIFSQRLKKGQNGRFQSIEVKQNRNLHIFVSRKSFKIEFEDFPHLCQNCRFHYLL